MAQIRDTLTAAQRRAIETLLTEETIGAAADKADIGRRTLYRWLALSTFREELRKAEADALSTVTRRLTAGANRAVTTLLHLADKSENDGIKLRASDAVLARLLSLREMLDHEERLLAIELFIEGQNARPTNT